MLTFVPLVYLPSSMLPAIYVLKSAKLAFTPTTQQCNVLLIAPPLPISMPTTTPLLEAFVSYFAQSHPQSTIATYLLENV